MSLEDEIIKLSGQIEKLTNILTRSLSGKESISNLTTDNATLTISQFCKSINISKALFYKMKKEGCGLKTITIGSRRLIRKIDADLWLQEKGLNSIK